MEARNENASHVPAIELEHVTFRYFEHGKHNVLEDASLSIPQGKITVIAGNSGCGKSTLAAVAAGLYPENGGVLSSGSIRLFGQPVGEQNPAARSRYLSMMFQNPDLQFCMDTLRKEMRFCLENICVPMKEMDAACERWAGKMDMTSFLDRKLYTLSGGEKQKAALACLFLLGSKAILMDEPFANIDEDGAKEIVRWIVKQNREQGLTVIAIDHRLDYWLTVADEVIVMGKGGKVLERGINRENFEAHKSFFDQEGLYYPGRYQREDSQEQEAEPALVLEDVSMEGLLQGASRAIRLWKNHAVSYSFGEKALQRLHKGGFRTRINRDVLYSQKGALSPYGDCISESKQSIYHPECVPGGGGELPPVAAEAGRRNIKGEGGGAAGLLRPWPVPEIFSLHAEPGAAEASGGAGGLGWGAGCSASGRAYLWAGLPVHHGDYEGASGKG